MISSKPISINDDSAEGSTTHEVPVPLLLDEDEEEDEDEVEEAAVEDSEEELSRPFLSKPSALPLPPPPPSSEMDPRVVEVWWGLEEEEKGFAGP
jgi:hypothetical protein